MALVCAVASASFQAACSAVPSAGPSKDAVFQRGAHPEAPFALVEIGDAVIDVMKRFPAPSLYGRFGDYRPAIEQRVGIGDAVSITVFEAAAGGLFSTPVVSTNQPGSRTAVIPTQVVQRDGSITMPYAGRIRVVGQTPQEIERTIVDRLTGKAIEPQAVVTLANNVSNTVTVTGEVTAGARVPLTVRGDRLLDVIAMVGGVRAPITQSFIELSRGNRNALVPLQAVIKNPRENIYMRPGDVLSVMSYPLTYTVVGSTLRNAIVPFEPLGMSLEEAVAKAGGLIDEKADPEGVFLMRYEPVQLAKLYPGVNPDLLSDELVPVAYHINMRDPNAIFVARRFQMHDKDILFVSNSPVTDLVKVLTVVNLVASPILTAAYAFK